MKKIISAVATVFLIAQAAAQSIGIGNTSTPPDSSAILDIRSVNKGILLPRLPLTGIYDSISIKKPAVSLVVFNTNPGLPGGLGFYAWSGTQWDVIISLANKFIKGKNRYTTMVDGDTREYWVHVPSGYDSTVATPVVFMLHGTSGNGEKFYDNSGWKELGEDENFISVFPSSWKYRIYDPADGIKTTTKWNTLPDADWSFMPGETPRDDIKFLKKIILELRLKFKVDTARIYLNGFSNGGQMAAKCAIEMSDKLAAVASNAGTFYLDTVYVPKRKLPVLYQTGNEDWGPGNDGPSVPLSEFDTLISTAGITFRDGKYYRIARRYINDFSLDSNYVLTGDTNAVMQATYHSLSGDTLNIFKYIFVRGLGHKYPNGDNHWFDAPRVHWAWMKRYRLP
jgi:polyhydroxybutyrate depolymerase